MPPFLGGGHMISRVDDETSTFGELPSKFEAGTSEIAEAVGLGAAVDYLSDLGMDNVRAHERELTAYALDRLAEVEGITVFGPRDPDRRGGVMSFALEGMHPHDIGELCGREGVCIRAGHHCAQPLMRDLAWAPPPAPRCHVYNSRDDVGPPGRRPSAERPGGASGLVTTLSTATTYSTTTRTRGTSGRWSPTISRPTTTTPSAATRWACTSACPSDGTIEDLRFHGQGCAISQAAASIASEELIGMRVDEIPRLDAGWVIELLGIDISPTRRKCALLNLKVMRGATSGDASWPE